jgi:hypothetical protein
MKSMVLIPLIVAGFVGSAAFVLKHMGVQFSPMDPLNAGAIAVIAAGLGTLPISVTRDKDAAIIVQRALIGTVLHVLCTAVLAVVLIASHVANANWSFVFWLLGAYWVSLVILVWQLRRVMLGMTATLKVQN